MIRSPLKILVVLVWLTLVPVCGFGRYWSSSEYPASSGCCTRRNSPLNTGGMPDNVSLERRLPGHQPGDSPLRSPPPPLPPRDRCPKSWAKFHHNLGRPAGPAGPMCDSPKPSEPGPRLRRGPAMGSAPPPTGGLRGRHIDEQLSLSMQNLSLGPMILTSASDLSLGPIPRNAGGFRREIGTVG